MKKWTKKLIGLLLICVLAMSMYACGSSSSSSAPAATDTKSEAAAPAETKEEAKPATDGEVYELSFTIHDPATSAKTHAYEELAKQVEEATDGHVIITVYSAGSLVAGTDVAEAVLNGVADMGWLCTPFFPGQFPLNEAVVLPMMTNDGMKSSEVLNKLYAENEDLQKEMSRYKVFHMYTTPVFSLCMTSPVRSPEDLKGVTIRATAGIPTSVVQKWGGNPVVMAPGDLYEAIEKGTIGGAVFEWSGIGSFKLQEIIKYYTEVGISNNVFYAVMNLDSWNSLPKEYQDIMDEIWGGEEVGMKIAKIFDDDYQAARKEGLEKYDCEVVELTEEELAAFQEGADEVINEWIEANSKNGFDAAAYVERVRELYAELG